MRSVDRYFRLWMQNFPVTLYTSVHSVMVETANNFSALLIILSVAANLSVRFGELNNLHLHRIVLSRA